MSNSAKFEVTDGPYAGVYEIDADEFTGAEVNRFRHAVGVSITAATDGASVDLDALCGFIWLIRTRSGGARGLAYQAVAENIKRSMIAPVQGDKKPDPADPTSSAAE